MAYLTVWPNAAFRGVTCQENHRIDRSEDGNHWCVVCDTGECPDCGEPTMYHTACGNYHHIYATPDCFLHRQVCSK